MPNRIIREGWLESEPINQLSKDAELFFLRLCLKADDFGRFHANPVLLKSNLYPLKEAIRSTDIPRWLAECEKAGLVRCYEHSSKQFLEIPKFMQRTRADKSKFPDPPAGNYLPPDRCLTNDGQKPVTRQTPAHGDVGVVGDGDVVDSRANGSPRHSGEEAWIQELQESETYQMLKVKQEYLKMVQWCFVRRKEPTRRRFINWLNNCDRPLTGSVSVDAKERIRRLEDEFKTATDQRKAQIREEIKKLKGGQ